VEPELWPVNELLLHYYNLAAADQVEYSEGVPYALKLGSVVQTLAGLGVEPGEDMEYVLGAFRSIFMAVNSGKAKAKSKKGQ